MATPNGLNYFRRGEPLAIRGLEPGAFDYFRRGEPILALYTLPPSRLVPRASYDVMVAWDRETSGGYFTLGTSLLSGTDVLAASSIVVPPFSGTYDSLDYQDATYRTRVQRITWSRGRDRTLASVEAGKATVEVVDPAGLFNPENTASPLYGMTSSPNRPVRIRATFDGTTYNEYLGRVVSLDYRPSGRRSVAILECQDLLGDLDAPPIFGTMTSTNTGAVIAAILSASAGFDDPAYLDLDTGDSIASFAEATGDSSGLALIEALLQTELGVFYQDRDFRAVYEDRNARAGRAVAYAFADTFPAVGPGTSRDRIVNRMTYQKTGGTAQTYTDTASADPRTGYGLRDGGTVTSPYIPSDAQALSLATYVVSCRKDPNGPLWSLTVEGRTAELLAAILDLDYGDRVTVDEAQTGTTFDGYIERLEHSVATDQRTHRATYILAQRPTAEVFVLGSSLIGGSNVLAL